MQRGWDWVTTELLQRSRWLTATPAGLSAHKPHTVTSLLLGPAATSWRAAPDVLLDLFSFSHLITKWRLLAQFSPALLRWAAQL